MTTCGEGANKFNRLHPTASMLKRMKKIVVFIETIPEYIPKKRSNKNCGKKSQERPIKSSVLRSGCDRT
jgi:hypothetical protein